MRSFLLFSICCFASIIVEAQDSANQAFSDIPEVRSKKRMIRMETLNGDHYKGYLVGLSNYSVVFDARGYNAASSMMQYYVRPFNNNYKIDGEYLKVIKIRQGRVAARLALGGALLGLFVLAPIAYQGSMESNDDVLKALGAGAVGAGIGFMAGGVVGGIAGLFTGKKIHVNGNPAMVFELHNYFDRLGELSP